MKKLQAGALIALVSLWGVVIWGIVSLTSQEVHDPHLHRHGADGESSCTYSRAGSGTSPAQRRDAEGFSLTAVVRVLREAAQGSPPIANALKNASLL
ncbi:MAG TPA: hypothetical protein EYG15_09885 [Deltaproteobacteria bacterium]|nr:hypothetical protein [Deltaproteobacteria bacterium]